MHCISVFLINKSELRNDKIDLVVDSVVSDIKWVELKEGILATTYIPNIEKFRENKTIARITTDYFGGAGEQSVKIWERDKFIRLNNSFGPINEALSYLGVRRKNGMDEFDTVGLGNYRSNRDF